MLLLTGASGTVGTALLRRLVVDGRPVRCLVRDPHELGADRVRVQIALGDLADPPSFRNAMRGVDTVIHLAGSPRDQAGSSIEELNGVGTWRDRKSTRLNSSHTVISYAVFCLKKKKTKRYPTNTTHNNTLL